MQRPNLPGAFAPTRIHILTGGLSVMAKRITRRQMLAASAASLGYFQLAPALSAAKIVGANGKLTVAGIGVGGKGDSDINDASNYMEVIAICDVDDGKLAPKQKKWPQATVFK